MSQLIKKPLPQIVGIRAIKRKNVLSLCFPTMMLIEYFHYCYKIKETERPLFIFEDLG